MGNSEELSEVPGIGSARARWLEATFGVRTLQDLANLAPQDIERKLKAESRMPVSRKMIESWIAEAQKRAAQEEHEPAAAVSRKGTNDEPAWKPVASFVTEFQAEIDEGFGRRWRTTVHYLEKDENETWAGIEGARLCDWMIQQLRRAVDLKEGEAPSDIGVTGRPPAADDTVSGQRVIAPARLPQLADGLDAYVVDGDGVERPSVIRTDKPWSVVFRWSVEDGTPEAEGEWRFDLLLKRVRPGKRLRLRLGPNRVPAAAPRLDGDHRYEFKVMPAAMGSSDVDAFYRAFATLMYRPEGEVREFQAGFVDVGLLRFYDPSWRSTAERAPST
jgi:hypothetical protein